ncbi:hypothetical protein [Streptomyces sp. R35]|uniref:Integral membrane protein n=1 Tax=Streptomyces sp. R35 TaxID=3238630 RepID=A0AB39SBI9_9ACTN
MGTKTVDEAGVETGTEAKSDQETVDVTKTDVTKADEATETESDASAGAPDDDEDGYDEDGAGDDQSEAIADKTSAGVGQGAAAVVSAALGLVSLTGSWLGTVGQARDSLYGQLETASTASVSTQIKQVYADSWNVNAFVAGLFALTALIVAVVVLARPAFGNPDRVQAPWIKSVAWAGVSLAIIGLLLAVLKYTDILMSMPST